MISIMRILVLLNLYDALNVVDFSRGGAFRLEGRFWRFRGEYGSFLVITPTTPIDRSARVGRDTWQIGTATASVSP